MSPRASTRPEVDRVLAIWRRRWRLAVPLVLLALGASVSAIVALPNVYRATATVLVEGQQLPETLVRSTVTNELESRLRAMTEEILSRARLDGLITQFGLYPDLWSTQSRDQLIQRLREDIKIDLGRPAAAPRGSSTATISVSYRGRDPDTAAKVANTLASFFVEENFKVRDRLASGTTDFLKAQLEQARARLAAQEQRISEFRSRHLGELPQQMQANLAMLERLESGLRLNLDSQTRLAERREALEKELTGLTPPEVGLDADARRLLQLREQLADLRIRFTDRYPDVVQVTAEIAALEAKLARPDRGAAPGSAPAPSPQEARIRQALRELKTELGVLKADEGRLRASIAVYQQRVENTPRREQEFQQLSRDYDSTQELYQSLLKRLNEAQLAENMEHSQKGERFRVIGPAAPPADPASPNRARLLVMAVALSVGLGAFVVLASEYLDSSFHTVDDVRQLTSAPLLTAIPLIVTDRDRARRHLWLRLGATVTTLSIALTVLGGDRIARDNWWLLSLIAR